MAACVSSFESSVRAASKPGLISLGSVTQSLFGAFKFKNGIRTETLAVSTRIRRNCDGLTHINSAYSGLIWSATQWDWQAINHNATLTEKPLTFISFQKIIA